VVERAEIRHRSSSAPQKSERGNHWFHDTGALQGTQNQFRYLPDQWTDFPFSVWAEEWGFFGCLALIAWFFWIILWTLNAALCAPERFGSVLCLGVGTMIFWQVVVNVGMVLGLAPVVGVTLPLVSYGGSSVLTTFIALGLAFSVSSRLRRAS
jgi:rod shape determining protein RodA